MKQKMKLAMAVVCGLLIAGNGWTLPFWYVFTGPSEWYSYVGKLENRLIFADYLREEYRILPDSYYYIDSDGYSHLKLDEKTGYDRRLDAIVIPGILDEYAFLEGIVTKEDAESHFFLHWDERHLRDIEKISSSPVLKETIGGKTVTYEPENLFRRFLGMQSKESNWQYWNAVTPPWAEGVAGPGIGANITINFKEPVKSVSVLNGFVDIFRKHLYRQNNRVAVLKVVDLDNNKEYEMEFEDIVYYNTQTFEKETRNIKLVIMSVYPGTKYDDTCITQIRYSSGGGTWEGYFRSVLNEYKKLD
jgi:hypothetical protein